MLLIDPKDGAIIEANEVALSFYGYSRDRLLVMRITEIDTLPATQVHQSMASISEENGRQVRI